MKNLDFTKTEDIVEFARNYQRYKNQVSLPDPVLKKINTWIGHYNDGIITSQELTNTIIDTILGFMKSLNLD